MNIWRKKYWHVWEILEADDEELRKLFPKVIGNIRIGVIRFLNDSSRLHTQIEHVDDFLYYMEHERDSRGYSLLPPIERVIKTLTLFREEGELKSCLSQLSNDVLEKYLHVKLIIKEYAKRAYCGKVAYPECLRKIGFESKKVFFESFIREELINRQETYGTALELMKDTGHKPKKFVMLSYADTIELKYYYSIMNVCRTSSGDLWNVYSDLGEKRCRFIINFLRSTDYDLKNLVEIIPISSSKSVYANIFELLLEVHPDVKLTNPKKIKIRDRLFSQV